MESSESSQRLCVESSASRARNVRGLLSAKVSCSSFAEAHSVLLFEPTHMEDEDIRRMKRKMRETVKSAKWRVEENQDTHCA